MFRWLTDGKVSYSVLANGPGARSLCVCDTLTAQRHGDSRRRRHLRGAGPSSPGDLHIHHDPALSPRLATECPGAGGGRAGACSPRSPTRPVFHNSAGSYRGGVGETEIFQTRGTKFHPLFCSLALPCYFVFYSPIGRPRSRVLTREREREREMRMRATSATARRPGSLAASLPAADLADRSVLAVRGHHRPRMVAEE